MPDRTGLSAQARVVWAKSHVDSVNGAVLDGWLPLHQHLEDAAEIAAHLWDRWAPRSVKRTLADAFGSEAHARALVMWLAGTHDIGKASPAFALKVPQLAERTRAQGLSIDHRIADDRMLHTARHEVVSLLAIREWLQQHHGFSRTQANALASVAAAHHGNPAGRDVIRAVEPLSHLVGNGLWKEVRIELLSRADALHADAADIDAWRDAAITQPVLVLVSSLVIVADWLASSNAFPVAPLDEQPAENARDRARRAWRELDFPPPWTAAPKTTDVAELLSERFSLSARVTPWPSQKAFVDHALHTTQPELMILEAEMGSGKTEAALLAAEILASRFHLSGIFLGLPTRATADGMFGRVLTWARRLGLTAPANIFLAHGAANLNPEYDSLTRAAFFRSIGSQPLSDDPSPAESVVAHRWFSAPRRGPLSDFVIGTIDQALFAGHRSRYLMLRHLALASKVVIIDEAHAYDDYMSTYLTRVLEWLGAYGVPVIMLSATLPSHRRVEFHSAYLRGRRALASPATPHEGDTDAEAIERALTGTIGYPLVTATAESGVVVMPTSSTGADKALRIERLPDDDAALHALVDEALREGGNMAIIRNTVRRAQQTAALLRSQLDDISVTVAHSHFLGIDRARKDRALLDRYGPRAERPGKSIVVATQVIESVFGLFREGNTSDSWPVRPYAPLLDRIEKGHRYRFRLTANPVQSRRLAEGGRGKVYGHVTIAQQEQWLLERQDGLGMEISDIPEQLRAPDGSPLPPVKDLLVSRSGTLTFSRRETRVTLRVATYDGALVVTDPDAFRRALTHGIGRAKGYGCGLLTIAPTV